MVKIKKVYEYEFEHIKNKLDFLIGNYATYNEYYLIEIFMNDNYILLGLQVVTGGIFPNVEIICNNILVTAGNYFYVFDENVKPIKRYTCEAAIFEMKVLDNTVIVYNELDIICLDKDMNIIWNREFQDIMDIYSIDNDFIKLVCNDEDIIININSGYKM